MRKVLLLFFSYYSKIAFIFYFLLLFENSFSFLKNFATAKEGSVSNKTLYRDFKISYVKKTIIKFFLYQFFFILKVPYQEFLVCCIRPNFQVFALIFTNKLFFLKKKNKNKDARNYRTILFVIFIMIIENFSSCEVSQLQKGMMLGICDSDIIIQGRRSENKIIKEFNLEPINIRMNFCSISYLVLIFHL